MQNAQQMAAMAAMNPNMGGPVNGTPIMANMQRPGQNEPFDPPIQLNTYIYDYFLRNNHHRLARAMIECDLKMKLNPDQKSSPNGRNVNGVTDMDGDDKLPQPAVPPTTAENSFLMDWWCQFWDIYRATRDKGYTGKSVQYTAQARSLAQLQNDQRTQRMMMSNNLSGAQYARMLNMNGVGAPNDLKRAAVMNNRNPNGANPMANMNQIKNQALMSAQMQRDGSNMDMNGQRPQSPGSNENAPSPNKRPRVEGGMNPAHMGGNQFNDFAQQQNVQQKNIEVHAHNLAHQQTMALNKVAMAQAMTGVQGSPMPQQGLDGQHEIFAGNQPRPQPMPPGAPGQPQQGNHALQDYQMQLMLLEQQNKKRLLMARQEQDNMSGGPHAQGGVGGPAFAAQSMSPQGSRAGPSPNPADQMKRGTPKMPQQGLPGSPLPDGSMQPQRNSPAPNIGFDMSQVPGVPPQGIPPQFAANPYGMQQNPMMRPPSSHPQFAGQQQITPQQLEALRQQQGQMPNGAWRGGPGGPQGGMMPAQGQQMGGPMNGPQQRNNQMPPPPAPAGEQPRAQEPSPSQPAQAPPTPNQGNKANPKKKPTKDNKKPAKAKGANTGATPAASSEDPAPTPTPSTPITPMHPKSFTQNGQPQPGQPPAQAQPAAAPQQQPAMENNANQNFVALTEEPSIDFDFSTLGGSDNLESFDFDSFLHVGDDGSAFGSLGGDFNFGDTVEAGGELA